MSKAYYNEFDKKAAAWLRELIRRGLIANGDVDERSINDVRADELRGYTQCHFFAGIGGWSLALRLAGWPDDREVWTGSCPCQPFSTAGAGKGFADERHLWPDFYHLIEQCRPAKVFGEQVAGPDGLVWLDLVQADLEAAGYAVGAADLCAAGIGAPHIRQRLYWVAHPDDEGLEGREPVRQRADQCAAGSDGVAGRLGEPDDERFVCAGLPAQRSFGGDQPGAAGHGEAGEQCATAAGRRARTESASTAARPTNGFWRDADWLGCRDGKWRPVEPGTFPLVDGLPRGVVRGRDHGQPIHAARSPEGRVMRLRGYGNAISPQVAEAFIRASVEAASEI